MFNTTEFAYNKVLFEYVHL